MAFGREQAGSQSAISEEKVFSLSFIKPHNLTSDLSPARALYHHLLPVASLTSVSHSQPCIWKAILSGTMHYHLPLLSLTANSPNILLLLSYSLPGNHANSGSTIYELCDPGQVG